MKKLLSRYEGENHEISVKIESLKTNVSIERKEDTIEQLKKVLRGFTEPEELSRELLFTLLTVLKSVREVTGKRSLDV